MEDTVTRMDIYDAFNNCAYITEIVIPVNMEEFDNGIEGCYSLEKYTVAEGNQYYAAVDGLLYDFYKTALYSVPGAGIAEDFIVPEGTISIDNLAFVTCNAMKTVSIPACTEKVGLRGGTQTMGSDKDRYENAYNNVFYLCNELTTIIVDEENKYYKSENEILFSKDGTVLVAFPAMLDAGDKYYVPDGVTTIGGKAFYQNKHLLDVEFPASLEVIQPNAFCWTNLETVGFSEGLTRIGYRAFRNTNLTEAILPDSVERIDSEAFSVCMDLAYVELSDSLNHLGKGAFQNCSVLTSITIPEGVTEIPDSAFAACRELTEVNLPSALTRIGRYAFRSCTALTEITLPGSLEYIDERALPTRKYLTTIYAPAGSVGADFAWENDYNLITY